MKDNQEGPVRTRASYATLSSFNHRLQQRPSSQSPCPKLFPFLILLFLLLCAYSFFVLQVNPYVA